MIVKPQHTHTKKKREANQLVESRREERGDPKRAELADGHHRRDGREPNELANASEVRSP